MVILPKELWLLIFEDVPPENAASIARTCKAWRDLISMMWSRWSKRFFPWHQKLPTYDPKLLIEGETNWKKNKYSVKELYQHKDGVRCVRLTPERLYSGNDKRIVAMNLATEKVEWKIQTAIQCPTLEIENERIIAGQNQSHICIFNTNDGSVVHKLEIAHDFSDHVYHIGLTHKYLIAKSSSNFCVFDKNTLQLIHHKKHNPGRGHGLSVNEKMIAYGTDTCTNILDHNSLEVVGTMKTKSQHSPQLIDEELLSNEGCDILFWDIRNFSQKHRIQLNDTNPFDVRFVYDKAKLVVDWTALTGQQCEIQKVDPNSGEILHTYRVNHGNSCFAMDATRMVIGSNALQKQSVTLLKFTRLQRK